MSDFDPKNFSLDQWWKALTAAGAAIVLSSIAVKFVPTILVGLGLIALGLGEWDQHPRLMRPVRGGVETTYERMSKPLGLLIQVFGAALLVIGLYKLVLA